MKMTIPVSDLKDKYSEISKTIHQMEEPVIVTKNG